MVLYLLQRRLSDYTRETGGRGPSRGAGAFKAGIRGDMPELLRGPQENISELTSSRVITNNRQLVRQGKSGRGTDSQQCQAFENTPSSLVCSQIRFASYTAITKKMEQISFGQNVLNCKDNWAVSLF